MDDLLESRLGPERPWYGWGWSGPLDGRGDGQGARQVAPPDGWTLRLFPYDTGTGLARFNRSTGVGVGVQPLFTDQGALEMLVVGSYYPPGFRRFTEEVVKQIERAAQLDLGPAYSVSANHAKLPGTNLEGVELTVMRNTVDPREPKGR